jgi:hypothetical protein
MSNNTLWQIASVLPARLSDLVDLPSDTWFAIAAVMTLWIYMIFAPGSDPSEL